MKIILSGYHNPHFMTVTEYAENAIRALSHDLVTFNDADFLIPGRIRSAFKPLADFDLKRLNNKLVGLNKLYKPDICIVCDGYRILPECVREIKRMGITAVLWTMDLPHDPQSFVRAAAEYDYIFCAGTEAIEILSKQNFTNLYWLPFACDTDFHRVVDVSPEDLRNFGGAISFVGSFYPNRMDILQGIADFDLGVWGPGWERVPQNSPLSKCVRKAGNIKPEDWVKIFCSSRINLTLHFQDGLVPCYQASPKVFEILSCRGFLLCDNQKDVVSLFEDGSHLIIFKDAADLRQKIKYYLDREEERRLISAQGYTEVVSKHTYVHRLRRMFEIINMGDVKRHG